jgi:hypothetical protein
MLAYEGSIVPTRSAIAFNSMLASVQRTTVNSVPFFTRSTIGINSMLASAQGSNASCSMISSDSMLAASARVSTSVKNVFSKPTVGFILLRPFRMENGSESPVHVWS